MWQRWVSIAVDVTVKNFMNFVSFHSVFLHYSQPHSTTHIKNVKNEAVRVLKGFLSDVHWDQFSIESGSELFLLLLTNCFSISLIRFQCYVQVFLKRPLSFSRPGEGECRVSPVQSFLWIFKMLNYQFCLSIEPECVTWRKDWTHSFQRTRWILLALLSKKTQSAFMEPLIFFISINQMISKIWLRKIRSSIASRHFYYIRCPKICIQILSFFL